MPYLFPYTSKARNLVARTVATCLTLARASLKEQWIHLYTAVDVSTSGTTSPDPHTLRHQAQPRQLGLASFGLASRPHARAHDTANTPQVTSLRHQPQHTLHSSRTFLLFSRLYFAPLSVGTATARDSGRDGQATQTLLTQQLGKLHTLA